MVSHRSIAQINYGDSLRTRLNHTSDYEKKIDLLGKLSDYYSTRDTGIALNYALEIKRLAESQKDSRRIGWAYYHIGGVYFETQFIDSAIQNYERAIPFLEKDSSYLAQQTLAKVWYNIGAQYQRKGDNDTFLDYILNKANPIYEKIGDSIGLGQNYHNIGIVFENIREYGKAAEYHRKSIEILRNHPETVQLVDAYIKLAECIIYMDDGNGKRGQEAKAALHQADSLLNKRPDDYSRILYHNTMGMYAEALEKDYDKALQHFDDGLVLAHASPGLNRLSPLLLTRKYYIYDKQGKHDLALATTLRITNEYAHYTTSKDRLLQLKNAIQSYEKLGQIDKAFAMQKRFITLNDSLNSAETKLKIYDLEQKYEAAEKESHIMRLQQEMQAKEITAQKNRTWVLLMAIAIIFIAGLLISNSIISRKKQQIAKQEAKLLEKNMEQMKRDQHIELFAAMLEGQEQERNRLALDLHDGLGGSLSSIKMKLSKLLQGNAANIAQNDLALIVGHLDTSVDDLRRIARNLMPETLLKYGLETALRDFCRSLETTKTNISFQSYGLHRDIPKSIQIMVFRIVQELITNSMKHASASHILVQCIQDGNHISMTVEDDGIGFDVDNEVQRGMGLANVRTRIQYLGGKLDIASEKNIGTTVNMEISYGKREETD